MNPGKFLICDIETTSKEICSAEIITASFIKCDSQLNIIDHQNFKMAPTYWTLHHDEATQIHGIDRRTAFQFPEKQSELKRLVEWIQDGPYYFTCHANRQNKSGWVTFDYAVLKQELFDMNMHYELYRFCPTKFICSTHSLAKNLDRIGKIHIPLRVRDGNKKRPSHFA